MSTAIVATPTEPPEWAVGTNNLCDPRMGAAIVSCSDDFFAAAPRMLTPGPAVFYPDKYDDNGKWMDGWESRRKRVPGHDWCIVRLARPGMLAGLDLDTSFFTGNFPPSASLEGCPMGSDPGEERSWTSLLPVTALKGNRHHLLQLPASDAVYSHVRLNIFPDGGIARLRVFGRISPAFATPGPDGLTDLAALLNGGRGLAWNDAHFGAVSNMLLPGRGANMGEGWETRRRREPGHDWCVIALGRAGTVRRLEIDTAFFKGNFPHRVSLQAAYLPHAMDVEAVAQSEAWPMLLEQQPLSADSVHTFVLQSGPVSHVRLNIHPDGGISRLRIWGVPE